MLSGRSFMSIKNRSGPNTDPCGTPETTSFHSEVWQFKTTLSMRFWRWFLKSESSSPWTPYVFNYKRPSCQTLSNVLDISKKTPLTSTVWFSSNAVCISWIFDSNWAIHESPGRKPDWEDVKSLLLIK